MFRSVLGAGEGWDKHSPYFMFMEYHPLSIYLHIEMSALKEKNSAL